MDGQPAIDQAKHALRYTLERIRDNSNIGYHLGLGTQTFALLTEAAATCFGAPLEQVRRNFACADTNKPDSELLRQVREAFTEYVDGPGRCTTFGKSALIEKLTAILNP
jgi:hypothetical protein